MKDIQSVGYNTLSFEPRSKQQNQTAGDNHFEALLSSFDPQPGKNNQVSSHPLSALVEEFLGNITSTLDNFSALVSQVTPASKFPFTESFKATFGTSGPLINFIIEKTAKLNLTAEQNQAFQQIAINNKDVIKTPETIQKIAMELQQAGIG